MVPPLCTSQHTSTPAPRTCAQHSAHLHAHDTLRQPAATCGNLRTQGPQAPGGFFTDLFSAGIEVSQDLGAQALKMLLTTLLPLALLVSMSSSRPSRACALS